MSIDDLVLWVLLPVLKYPILIVRPFHSYGIPISLYGHLVLYSTIVGFLCLLNNVYKTKGGNWKQLNEIKDLKVFLTGGSDGLGEIILKQILGSTNDVKVVNVDIKPSNIKDHRLVTYICDMTKIEALEQTIDTIKKEECPNNSHFHLIINNAGMRSKFKFLNDQDRNTIDNIMNINAIAPVRIIQELTPPENSDKQCYIVNVASALGILAPARVSIYAASKAALMAFHESYSFELLSKNVNNIRTLLVIPGQLNTKMFAGFQPPRQFFAPVIEIERLASSIINKIQRGERGKVNAPFYSNFAHVLMSLPITVQMMARKFADMDECLPNEE